VKLNKFTYLREANETHIHQFSLDEFKAATHHRVMTEMLPEIVFICSSLFIMWESLGIKIGPPKTLNLSHNVVVINNIKPELR